MGEVGRYGEHVGGGEGGEVEFLREALLDPVGVADGHTRELHFVHDHRLDLVRIWVLLQFSQSSPDTFYGSLSVSSVFL